MTQPTPSRFPVPPVDSLPEDIRSRLLTVQEKSGFIPNVFLTLAFRPDEFRAFFAYHDALMDKGRRPHQGRARDDRGCNLERQSVPVLRDRPRRDLANSAKNPLIADQIASNYRKADITPRQRAMLDFAMKVSQEAHLVSDADFAELSVLGFSYDDVWDIAAISAFFALSNRIANVAAMRPNDEFYLMGRLPKA